MKSRFSLPLWERNFSNALARRASPPMVRLPQVGQGFR